MSTAETRQVTDVFVVGAGPVGLVAGCELARRGVRVRVIDKLAQPTEQSRAIAVHARSLDMFDRMGIVDEMLSTGIKATAMQLYAGHSKLFRVPLGDVDSAFPFTLTTAQTETERVLVEHLRSLGVTVERGVELAALNQDAQGVHLTLRHDDGSTEAASASWVDRGRRRPQHSPPPGGHQARGFLCRRTVPARGRRLPSTSWTWIPCTPSSLPTDRWSCCRCGTGGCGSSPRCTTHPEHR